MNILYKFNAIQTILTGIVFLPIISWGNSCDNSWQINYKDNFNYSQQDKNNTTFNTWFWREDSIGVHYFNYTDTSKECTEKSPCVKLTAPYQPDATAYINSEMYNNSCVRQGVHHPALQAFDLLGNNPLSGALQQYIRKHCDQPYPYRDDPTMKGHSRYANTSWNTTTSARLYSNPWAFASNDAETPWQAVRDIAFNSLYLTDQENATRMSMRIKAEGTGGGSRGWGYWNTSLDPELLQLAWFMEYSTQESDKPDHVKKTVVMQTMRFADSGTIGLCSTVLPEADYSIYAWHNYQIEWSSKAVNYFIDGNWVASHTGIIPNLGMAFHNWVDNRNYFKKGQEPANFPLFKEKSNYINSFRIETMPDSVYKIPSGTPAYKTECLNLTPERDLIELLKKMAEKY